MDATPVRILIINPNTSSHMTEALRPILHSLNFGPVRLRAASGSCLMGTVEYSFFTSPSGGISSINSPADAVESAKVCLPALVPLLPHHDLFLVACYSQHPLVTEIKLECEKLAREATQGVARQGTRKHVTGIFEASVVACLGLVGPSPNDGFGIVSTGKVWEEALRTAVDELLGSPQSHKFVSCETTGLNAGELHGLPADVVNEKMEEATKKLLRRGKKTNVAVKAICLGCAGMVGLEEAVRRACLQELGEEEGKLVSIVDGVKAGAFLLTGLARCGF